VAAAVLPHRARRQPAPSDQAQPAADQFLRPRVRSPIRYLAGNLT
jgi:hypothetical protein